MRFARPALRVWRFVLAAVFLAAFLAAMSAGQDPLHATTTQRIVTDPHTGLALYGIDPVGFYTNKKPTPGRAGLELRYGGAIWLFENEGNRAAFVKDPEVYMPRYGGYDPVAVARGVATAGYAELWSVVENRLYLFYSAEAQKAFLADPQAAAAAADARWPVVMRSLAE